MNERLSFLEDVKPLPASDQLRFVLSVISKGFMKDPEEIEKALTPILVSLEVMESQIALLNDLLEAKRIKRLKKAEKRQAKIAKKMEKWGMT